MKTKNYGTLCLLAATLVVGGMTFNSCKDDEESPVPEIVENPLEKEAYFITGKVTDGTNPLKEATVTTGSLSVKTDADGGYQLEVDKKGSFDLNFEKDGYIAIKGQVTIDSKADKGAIVSYSQALTKKAEPVKVDPAKESKVAPSTDLDVTIPAGAVKEETEITMTPFVPAADKEAQKAAEKVVSSGATTPVTVTTTMSLASINCEPDGLKFEKPVEVKLKASEAAGGVYFTKARHYVNGVDNGTANYDASSNSYVITLNGFSVHEVKVATDLSVSAANESLHSEVIDNIGKTAPVSKKITFKVKQGWKIASKSTGVTGDVEAKLMAAVTNTLSSKEGVSETEMEKEVAVSGDVKMTVAYSQSLVSYTFAVETSAGTESIVAEKYDAVSQSIEKVNGTMKPDHN
mgnify:FL=1